MCQKESDDIYVCLCVCVYIYMCVYVCMYGYIYIYICAYVCIHMLKGNTLAIISVGSKNVFQYNQFYFC
jgi:hypothetical protein